MQMHLFLIARISLQTFFHTIAAGVKKVAGFPRKAEFGASIASSFVQPDTPHPPDGEGLGP